MSGSSLGEAVLDLTADGNPLKVDMSKAKGIVLSSVKSVGSSVNKLGSSVISGMRKTVVSAAKVTAIAVGAISTALFGLGVKAVNMAGDAVETMGKFDVTFGDFAGDTEDKLDGFAKATGRSRYALIGMAADLGAVMKGMGLTEGMASELSVGFSTLAVDVGSFNNMQAPEVANRFRAALSGEYESLKALGIVINQAMVDQELLNMGITGGAKAASQAELVQARYNLIMAATADAQGDAARTSASWANQMVRVKARVSDTVTDIGLKLLPVLTPLLTKVGDLADEYLPRLADAFGGLISYFAFVVEEGDPLNDFLMDVPESIRPLVQTMGEFIALLMDGDVTGALKEIFPPELVDSAMAIKNAIVDFVTNALIPFVKEHAEELKGALIGIGAVLAGAAIISGVLAIAGAIAALANPITAIIAVAALLGAAWAGNWGGIRDTLMEVWDNVQPVLQELWVWLQENIPIAIEKLKNFWDTKLYPALQAVWKFLSEDMMPVWEALGELLEVVIVRAIEAVVGIWQNVLKPAFEDIKMWISEHIKPLFDDWAEGIGGVQGAIETVVGWIQTLTEKLSNMELPDWMTPGSPTPWENGLRGITDAMSELARTQLPKLHAELSFGGMGGMVPAMASAPRSGGAGEQGSIGGGVTIKIDTMIGDERWVDELADRIIPVIEIDNERRGL